MDLKVVHMVLRIESKFFFLARSFDLDWMWPLMARNLIGTFLLCGVWDWILYFSTLKERLHQFKVIQTESFTYVVMFPLY